MEVLVGLRDARDIDRVRLCFIVWIKKLPDITPGSKTRDVCPVSCRLAEIESLRKCTLFYDDVGKPRIIRNDQVVDDADRRALG